MTTTAPGWTEDRFNTMKNLWLEGATATQIARHLGGVTPSAVGGKIRRSGLVARSLPTRPQRSIRRQRKMPELRADPFVSSFVELIGLETVATLEPHLCKWPIGDPLSDSFMFCGRKKKDEKRPYCVDHDRIAFQPQSTKKKGSGSRAESLFRSVEHYL